MSKLKPINGNVLLLPIESKEEVYGNIIIPDMGQETPSLAEVISVSPLYNFNQGVYVDPIVKPGDKVFVPRMGGTKIVLGYDTYWVISEQNILGLLKEEE